MDQSAILDMLLFECYQAKSALCPGREVRMTAHTQALMEPNHLENEDLDEDLKDILEGLHAALLRSELYTHTYIRVHIY